MPEDYKPQKHEFGTPEASDWAKSMTPGQENSTGFPAGKKKNSAPEKKMKTFLEHLRCARSRISRQGRSPQQTHEGRQEKV